MSTIKANKVVMYMDDHTLTELITWAERMSSYANPDELLACTSAEPVNFNLDTYEEV